MKSAPRLGLTILLAIGLIIGFVAAMDTIVYKMIGDEAVKYMQEGNQMDLWNYYENYLTDYIEERYEA